MTAGAGAATGSLRAGSLGGNLPKQLLGTFEAGPKSEAFRAGQGLPSEASIL